MPTFTYQPVRAPHIPVTNKNTYSVVPLLAMSNQSRGIGRCFWRKRSKDSPAPRAPRPLPSLRNSKTQKNLLTIYDARPTATCPAFRECAHCRRALLSNISCFQHGTSKSTIWLVLLYPYLLLI